MIGRTGPVFATAGDSGEHLMLAICTQCESAQDVEKAGIVCWFCGQEMSDHTRDHQGERGPSEWVGATAAG
jgi:predicted amidophosphoribosyltransferase